ncbi:MAG TPA: SRPBCC domain-containing protein [Chitinophagaceae bacterium]|nr:SRPBCC domain-containing protein [Chitinophagaceae bacterium]
MNNESYTATITVTATPQHVFNCLTSVSQWWSKDFEGSSINLNDVFVICHPGQHYTKQQLVEVTTGKKIVWLVTDSNLNWLEKDQHEWTNTKMIFTLTAADKNTVLQFTHEGLTPAKECYTRCTQGWDMVIKEKLFDFIATGKGI